MFEVGDLGRHKASGIIRDRDNPLKRFGIIISIENEKVKSLWGVSESIVTVRWMPWNQEQKMTGACLEHMKKTS